MTLLKRVSLLPVLAVCCTAAWGAPGGQDPYAGYVYPAGGKQGTTIEVTIRGQRLRGTSGIHVSGQGVQASVIGYEGPTGPLNRLQQDELKRRLQEIGVKRFGGKKQGKAENKQAGNSGDNTKVKPVALPDIPELRNLEQMTAQQLKQIANKFLNPLKRPKPPIAEKVTLKVTLDPNAAPDDRELRLQTPNGLSNPLVFQVGSISEICEPDADKVDAASSLPPVVLNGQIMPGEVDSFTLQLRGGQKLVVAVQARKLIPYLADAVPGWFQAVAALYDSNGKEVAFNDDCGFDPDPAFVCKVPKDGRYVLKVRDALYRGREDFVYRVAVGDESLVKSLFPSGSRGGVTIGSIDQERSLKMAREQLNFTGKPLNEAEPNDTGKIAMPVTLPHVVSGVIKAPGDKDVLQFNGRAGDLIVAEVYARRMGSPLDSLLRLIDTSGRVVAWNDDQKDMESGLLTHHADSYLSVKLPATGRYFLQLSDAQSHGGLEYGYFLRIGPPQPDFALRMTPSSLNVFGGRAATLTIYAARKDGWDGDIEIALKNAPAGFTLSDAKIPKGKDHVRMTLTVPRKKSNQPVALQLEGRAQIGGKTVSRPVIPADDMMQAFAYHHLVPSEQLLVTVLQSRLK